MSRPIAGITLSDPTFTPKGERTPLERFALRFIQDERDLPFLRLCTAMTLVLMPMAAALFWPGVFRWWMAPIYWAVLFGVFVDRYILMLHNTSHRRFFKKKYDLLNRYVPWVLGPFCGESPETYFVHHVTMHHAEANLPADLSSTMRYQRDSLLDFGRYFLRFFLIGLPELAAYELQKGRRHLVRRLVVGELGFYAFCVGMGFVEWRATLVVFVMPFLVVRFLMMAGNWGQHAFVDGDDPGNPYKSSITCINSRYNRRCFNDGYHIGHHVRASRHWTEMPEDFSRNRRRYADEDAVVFEGLDYFVIWLLLMLHRYDTLASHFVELRDVPRDHDEVVALLRERTRRIPESVSALAPEPELP